MKFVILVLLTVYIQFARAQFTGLDDFSATTKNTLKWGTDLIEGAGVLSVSGDGVVRYSLSGAAGTDDFMAWPWIVGNAPFTQSWSVQADVHVPVIPLAPGFTAVGMGIAVLHSADPEDAFTAALENLRSGPDPQSYHFLNSLDVNGTTVETYAPTTLTNAAVRLSWDAATQVLSAAYDANGSAGGYAWTTFRTFNPVGATNWNMTSADTFEVYLVGYSEGTTVTLANNVYADNFYVLDNSLPSLNISHNGNQVQLSWSRLAPGFDLQSSPAVSGVWSAVTNAISISAEQNTVTLSVSDSANFFRLRK